MQQYFHAMADFLGTLLQGDEQYLASFSAEDSDFVRFNNAQVRQAMHVAQRYLSVNLIDGKRHIEGGITLSGEREVDEARLTSLMSSLRERVGFLPEDPYLLYSTDPRSTERVGQNALPPSSEAVHDVMSAGKGLDLVGIFGSGGIYHGFANSLGQRNWFATYSHNTDWSLYHSTDKAVKTGYAGFSWDRAAFEQKMQSAREQLGHLKNTPKTIDPGKYRVYLAPAALEDVIGMMAWGGFGMKDHRTKQTPLLKMIEEGAHLRGDVSLAENTAEGVAADFQDEGFIKPPAVNLIDKGRFNACLCSPRSAQEYGVDNNGATESESPESLDMAAGQLAQDKVMSELGTGLYVNNLHYLNYSDRNSCRITGMTRFATFWVDKGRIVAPVNVMRFDETIYRVLGENLVGLTKERDFLLNAMTYGARSTASTRLPGALIEDFTFTL